MGKKPFNWVGFCWVTGYFVGLLFFAGGVVWVKINPDSKFAIDYGDRGAASTLLFLGVTWFIIGAILVPVFYKKSVLTLAIKVASETAPTFSTSAKMISRNSSILTGSIPVRGVHRSPHSVGLQTLTFEFRDGTRKTFSVPLQVFVSIVENDVEMLTYKEQGTYLFFVSFQRQT
ncbi:MAG: DUF2500 domain-containing protein [Oscillospiraceae bacterium]|jgi:hypothetical protein|nr:DUF2500 domain-containing protein [Oscillospiraceae bacterium]